MTSSIITFGPVPSRRLGRSLGINNIPPKVCSYSCIYCQVGRTLQHEVEPRTFYHPAEIQQQVATRIKALRRKGETIDYITFVPDGEPTLDANLGEAIEMLRPFGIKIAVISNGSLLWQPEVRQTLQKADWVSVKIDTVGGRSWRRINRPHPDLRMDVVRHGIQLFAEQYSGDLATEIMLVKDFNDTKQCMTAVVNFIAKIHPCNTYLAVPTRPPAEKGVRPPAEDFITYAYHLFKKKIPNVKCLLEYEGDEFSSAGNIAEDLVSITSVHPMREDAVKQLLENANKGWDVVDSLIREGKITITEYEGNRFYLRKLSTGIGGRQHDG